MYFLTMIFFPIIRLKKYIYITYSPRNAIAFYPADFNRTLHLEDTDYKCSQVLFYHLSSTDQGKLTEKLNLGF